jgi:hypothetical protein
MKRNSFINSVQFAAAACSISLPLLLTSCQNLPPAEQMSDAQREAYVEHRKWDFEAEKRKEIDAEHRR